MLHNAWQIFLELAPWVLLGTLMASLLHVWIPARWFRRQLSGRAGVLKAVALGVPMPLCSCSVIPVGLSLEKSGASKGSVLGFLISTPQTGVDSILVTSSFLGLPFALLKVVVAAVTGLVGGWLVGDQTSSRGEDRGASEESSGIGASQSFVDHASMLLRSIWVWIVVGVVASALITSLVPAQSLAGLSEFAGLPAMLLTLLIALPLYVCATASVPVAAALVASGLPSGAALVFLMAGPATNLATIGAVHRALGGRSLVVYLTTVIVGSLGSGLVFNGWITPPVHEFTDHEHGASWWRIVSAIALGLVLLWFLGEQLRHWISRLTRQKGENGTRVLRVEGMTCQGCADRLTRALERQAGVSSAKVSFEDRRAVVSGSASSESLEGVVRSSGFEFLGIEAGSAD